METSVIDQIIEEMEMNAEAIVGQAEVIEESTVNVTDQAESEIMEIPEAEIQELIDEIAEPPAKDEIDRTLESLKDTTTTAKIRYLWALGWTNGDISRRLNISQPHVNNTLTRLGLPINRAKAGRGGVNKAQIIRDCQQQGMGVAQTKKYIQANYPDLKISDQEVSNTRNRPLKLSQVR